MLKRLKNMIKLVFIGRTGTEGGRYIQIARNSERTQKVIVDDVPFPCNVTGTTFKKSTFLYIFHSFLQAYYPDNLIFILRYTFLHFL